MANADSGRVIPKGMLNLRIWSDEVSLRRPAEETGLTAEIIHEKGAPVRLANGIILQKPSSNYYVSFKGSNLESVAEANQRIQMILNALYGRDLARLIADGAVRAEIDLAAFRGDIDWEAELSPSLIEAVRAANIELWICHYDKFTDEGAPLSVRL